MPLEHRPECLVVDDSRLVRKIARAMLESLGMRVREADGGLSALAAMRVAQPDMLLLDWNMDDLSGPDVIALVRADTALAGAKVLLCSTEDRLPRIRKAMRGGADSYLQKPFDKARLAHRIRRFGLLAA